MKFLLRLILIVVFGYFLPFYLPWWTLMIIAFLVGYAIPGNGFNVFNAGFLAGGLIWMGLSFKLDLETNSLLSEKIVQEFPLNDGTMLIILAGFIGAFAAGFGAVTGNSFRKLFLKKVKKSMYS